MNGRVISMERRFHNVLKVLESIKLYVNESADGKKVWKHIH